MYPRSKGRGSPSSVGGGGEHGGAVGAAGGGSRHSRRVVYSAGGGGTGPRRPRWIRTSQQFTGYAIVSQIRSESIQS